MTDISTVSTSGAPTPAGPYNQAVCAGNFIFLAGQTARVPGGGLIDGAPEDHCRQALTNLATVAAAAGGSLDNAVKVHVYLADLAWKPVFDAVYQDVVGGGPARSTVCAVPPTGYVEVDAILYLPQHV